MIRNLQLSNFKCFQNIELPLAPLTLLAGTNASGKSSVMQALLLLRQSHYHGALGRGELLLSSNLTNVGTAGDVLCEQAADDEIRFALRDDQGRQSNFSFLYRTAEKEDYVLRAGTQESVDYVKDLNLFAPQFNYLNAEREGPRLQYPMAERRGDSTYVGVKGQYAAHVLVRHGGEPIGCAALAYRNDDEREVSKMLANQTEYWMRTIVPKFAMEVKAHTSEDQVRVMLSTETGKPVRPTNTGFGIMYTLPVVVATLVAKQGSLVMIENPEAHLHPLGQSRIGYFLAQAAAAGIQIIIETHSDHVLNGIRRAVRHNAIQAENVALHFFESAGKLVTPQIFPDGGIMPWPDGFFDQTEKDLMELF